MPGAKLAVAPAFAFAALAALTGAAACGDDGTPTPDAGIVASAYDGLWLMSSITLPADAGGAVLPREGGDQTIRGDAVFTATSATTGTLSVRQAALVSGVLASDVSASIVSVTLEADRWLILEPEGGTAVFAATRTGEHLELALDAADPRHTSTSAPQHLALDRAAPWGTTVVGDWRLVTMTLPGDRAITAGACTELVPSSAWAKIEMPIAFTPRLLFERELVLTAFSDAGCATMTGTSSSTQRGLVEEEGAVLRMWGVENASSELQQFTLASDADVVTLTRTACLPQPACESAAPLVVVVRRAP